jgi:hypothetical protein
MMTREEPYRECTKMSSSQLKHHILSGHPPINLQRIINPIAKDFIQLCLQSQELRPSAESLLQHEFLNNLGEADDDEVSLGPVLEIEIPLIDIIADSLTRDVSDGLDAAAMISEKEMQAEPYSSSKDNSSSSLSDPPTSTSKQDKAIITTLENSEDVYHDKGVHDGRRDAIGRDEDIVLPTPSAANHPSTRNFVLIGKQQLSPNVSILANDISVDRPGSESIANSEGNEKKLVPAPAAVISCAVISVQDRKLQLVMTIPSAFRQTSSDPTEKESLQIEFEFDIDCDLVEVSCYPILSYYIFPKVANPNLQMTECCQRDDR